MTSKETQVDHTKSTLTDAEVNQISQLIETLDRSTLDFLQIDSGGIKVTIGKGNVMPSALAAAPQQAPAAAPVAAPAAAPAVQATAPAAPAAAAAKPAASDGGLVIKAPMMGRFYSKPDPASPPFVTVGSEVDASTSVGLIEVMKLFNTVQSGIEGVITEICVPDGEFIEYGAPLFKLRPKGQRAGS
jgi:acetyl-CoA carboxylase biotin carboxyl carrier protein